MFSSPARISWLDWKPRKCGSAWTARGGILDNIFIERLWRSLKYEEIFLKAYGSPAEARSGIGAWLTFYNDVTASSAHGYRIPREVFTGMAHGYVDNVSTLTTYPQAQQQQEKAFTDLNIKVSIAPVTPGGPGIMKWVGVSLNSARYLSNRRGPPYQSFSKGSLSSAIFPRGHPWLRA